MMSVKILEEIVRLKIHPIIMLTAKSEEVR